MVTLRNKNELEIQLPNKVVKLKGHQDSDAFTVFTESLLTHPALTEDVKEIIISEISKRHDIIIR